MRTVSLRALHRDPPQQPVLVTQDGEVVGTYYPLGSEPGVPERLAGEQAHLAAAPQRPADPVRAMSQAQRDAVLRRMAKA